MLTLTNVQVEADNLDCVTRSALLGSRKSALEGKAGDSNTTDAACAGGGMWPKSTCIAAILLYSCLDFAAQCSAVQLTLQPGWYLYCCITTGLLSQSFLSVIPFVDAVKAEDNHH